MAAVSKEAQERERQANRELYLWYKERGICTKCKKRYAAPGHVTCEACLKKHREYEKRYSERKAIKQKEVREQRKAQGLCVYCGRKAVKDRVLCVECARKGSEAQQVRKMRKRLAREAERERQISLQKAQKK